MTTQEIVKDVVGICSKFIEVQHVNYTENFNSKGDARFIELTVFYKYKSKPNRFSVEVYRRDSMTYSKLVKKIRTKLATVTNIPLYKIRPLTQSALQQ